MQFGKMLYLNGFWYSGVYEVIDYETTEVGVQIQIRDRRKPSKWPKDLAEKSIVRRVEG